MFRLNIHPRSFANDASDGPSVRLGGGRLKVPSWLFYPFIALLSLWVFLYVSGLVPYTGFKSGGFRSPDSAIGRVSFGTGDNDHLQTHRLFLIAGQTAIVDYDVAVREGQLLIAIQEGYLPLGPTLVEQGITSSGEGRVSAKVESTGIYTIYIRPRYRLDQPTMATDVSYTLWWGGLFGS